MSIRTAEHVNPAPEANSEPREVTSQTRAISFSEATHTLYATQSFIVGYLGEAARSHVYSSQRGMVSFSKAIPRRPERSAGEGFNGNYMELAYQTLIEASGGAPHTSTTEGSVIRLLGKGIESRYLQPRDETTTMVTEDSVEDASFYQDAVATLVWKAGFVKYPRGEDSVPYGEGEVNPLAEIYKTPVSPYNRETTHISIPYEPANPIHRLLVPPTANDNNRWRLELTMPSNISYGGHNEVDPYLDIGFVELPPAQEQAVAA